MQALIRAAARAAKRERGAGRRSLIARRLVSRGFVARAKTRHERGCSQANDIIIDDDMCGTYAIKHASTEYIWRDRFDHCRLTEKLKQVQMNAVSSLLILLGNNGIVVLVRRLQNQYVSHSVERCGGNTGKFCNHGRLLSFKLKLCWCK